MLLEMGLLGCLGYSGFEFFKIMKNSKKENYNIQKNLIYNLYEEYPIIYSKEDECGVQIATNYYIQNNKSYKDAMYLNTMIVGAPGAWKSTVGIYPNLYNKYLRGTLIINDPKGEFYDNTAQVQKEFGRIVKKISFSDIEDKINVLRELNTEDDINEFAKNIMINQYSVNSKITEDAMMWVNMSATLLTSLFCFVKNYKLTNNKNQRIDNITEAILLLQSVDSEEELDEILKNDNLAYKYFLSYKSNGVKSNIKNNILLSINTMMSIFLSENVKKVTSETTINLNQIRKKEYAIYLCADEIGSNKMAPIIAPMIQLFFKKTVELGPKPYMSEDEKSQILDVHFFLDEFGNMGKIENLNQYLTMLREYRVNVYMVLQTISQLYNKYSKAEVGSIMAGVGHMLFLTNNRDSSTVSKILEMSGDVVTCNKIKEYNQKGEIIKESCTYLTEKTITEGEASTIQTGEGLLFVGAQNILKIKFNRWFEEDRYKNYLNIPKVTKKRISNINNKLQTTLKTESLILKDFKENKKIKNIDVFNTKNNVSQFNDKNKNNNKIDNKQVKDNLNNKNSNKEKIVKSYLAFMKENF